MPPKRSEDPFITVMAPSAKHGGRTSSVRSRMSSRLSSRSASVQSLEQDEEKEEEEDDDDEEESRLKKAKEKKKCNVLSHTRWNLLEGSGRFQENTNRT